MFYTKKGFAFSVVLSFIYLFLIIAFTRDSVVILQASIRFCIFFGVAGVITLLSIKRKQVEEALRHSQANIMARTEAIAHVGSWELDVATGNVTWSDELFRIFKMNQSEGAPSIDKQHKLYHPEDLPRLLSAFETAVSNGTPYEIEVRAICTDGEMRVCLSQGYTEMGLDGRVLRIFGSFQDITERKQVENNIIEEQHLSRKYLQIAGVMMGVLNSAGEITLINKKGLDILEYKDEEELLGKNWFDISLPENIVAEVKGVFNQLMSGNINPVEYYENAVITKNGRERIVAFHNTVLRDKEDKISGILFSGEDITERKRMEDELKRIEWMLTKKSPLFLEEKNAHAGETQGYGDITELNHNGLILQSVGKEILHGIVNEYLDLLETSSAIYEKNGDYAFGIFSSSWCRMMDRASRKLCYTSDNMVALSSGKWLCHESCWTDCSRESIARCEPVDIECNGGIRLYAVPIFAGGQVIGAINFGYETPPRNPDRLCELSVLYGIGKEELLQKAMEYNVRPHYIIEMAKRRLTISSRLIGEMVERKQAEVEQKKLQSQLIQAQKMESVGRLAGGVAHDFNNMLGIIISSVELAMEDIDPGNPIIDNLEIIRNTAERSANLTKQLLAFARKQTIAPKILELNEIVGGMIKMLKRIIGENIDLLWKASSKECHVKMDPTQIDQILANLAVNARDAISVMGKITIEVNDAIFDEDYCAINPEYTPGNYVMLVVSDNGCGMDRETLSNIFEPFFTTKEVGRGSGLGLATVYGIVRQNNGFIKVYSEPGSGTTFKIYLPRYENKALVSEKSPEKTSIGGVETILLVEDELELLKMTEAILRKLGYNVMSAVSPGEALRIAGEYSGEIHLLITDVVMPDMNGMELSRQVISIYPNLKCLFTSGYTSNVIAHHGVLAKGVHFISKPFLKKDLADKIREVMN
jgi:PAS domain S-box-containing protein